MTQTMVDLLCQRFGNSEFANHYIALLSDYRHPASHHPTWSRRSVINGGDRGPYAHIWEAML